MATEVLGKVSIRDALFDVVMLRVYGNILSREETVALREAKTAREVSEDMQAVRMTIAEKITQAGITPDSLTQRINAVLVPLNPVQKDAVMAVLGMTACGPTPTRAQAADAVSVSVNALKRIERRALKIITRYGV